MQQAVLCHLWFVIKLKQHANLLILGMCSVFKDAELLRKYF